MKQDPKGIKEKVRFGTYFIFPDETGILQGKRDTTLIFQKTMS